jgi:hypothetical protein
LLKLLGGIALTVIAIRLTLSDSDDSPRSDRAGAGLLDLPSVIATVVAADLVMSADNVVALAAVAKGSFAVLSLGLLLSVPLLMLGSWYITALLRRYPMTIRLGGAMLGWFAGEIAVTDPLYGAWVSQQSPALNFVVPLLMAAYVVLQSRIIDQLRWSATALRPVPRPKLPASTRPPTVDAPSAPVKGSASASATASLVGTNAVRAPILPDLDASNTDERARMSPLDSGDDALASAAGRVRRGPRRAWSRWLTVGGSALVALGAAYGVINHRWMPVPADLVHYDCPSRDVSFLYRPGGQMIRMSNGINRVDGVVKYDNQIDWGDYHAASTTLGFVPPTRVLFGNAQSVHVDGGMFEDVTCLAH